MHGPEDLTFRRVAEILAEVLGHPVEPQRISDAELRSTLAGFGMSEAEADSIVMMTVGIRDDYTPENPRSVATTTPTTLKAWAAAHLA